MTRVVLAPDKFKGTLTAAEVADHLAAGIASVRPDVETTRVPVADGGDGLLDAALSVGFEPVPLTASGPLGRPRETRYAVQPDGVRAVVEMAEICGLARLPVDALDPMGATSRGLGEAIAHALDAGATEVLVGIGGSASTDGGAGMLSALGARFLDERGRPVPDGGGSLARVARVDLTGLHPRLVEATVTVACDVDNPLTGPQGAAAVYGPQKGADADQVTALDAALSHLADVLAVETGREPREVPGAGAAGGVGYGALAVLPGLLLRPGTEVVLEMTGLHDALPGADLVVTGEGALDEQTLHGKAPAGVAAAAAALGIPVVAVAGALLLDPERLAQAGITRAWAITDLASTPEESFARPGPLLEEVGRRVAALLP